MAVAMRILGGERPGDIKTPPSDFAPPKYDWRELQRWNISESRLPKGSEILFGSQRFWQRYSWQIALIIGVMLLQAGLISALCISAVAVNLPKCRPGSAWRSCPCQPLLNRRCTDALDCSRNQPAAWLYSDQRRNCTGNPEVCSPDIVELNEIVDDIVRDDRRASESHPKDEEPPDKVAVRTEKVSTSTTSGGKPSNSFRRWPSLERSN